jgi:hypothetical protein
MRGGFRAPVSARYFSNFPVGGAETGSISNRGRFVKSLADHHLIFYQRRDRMQSPRDQASRWRVDYPTETGWKGNNARGAQFGSFRLYFRYLRSN